MILSHKLQRENVRSTVCPSPCHSDRPPRWTPECKDNVREIMTTRPGSAPPCHSDPPLGRQNVRTLRKNTMILRAKLRGFFCSVQGLSVSLPIRSPPPCLGRQNVRVNDDSEAPAAKGQCSALGLPVSEPLRSPPVGRDSIQ